MGERPRRSEAVAHRPPSELRQLAERAHAEPLQRREQRRRLLPEAEQADRLPGEPAPGVRMPSSTAAGAERTASAAASAQKRVGPPPMRSGRPSRPSGRRERRRAAAVDALEPVRPRSRPAPGRPARPPRRSTPAQRSRASQVSPTRTGSAGHERQLRTACERLAEEHPARHPEGLGGARDLAHPLAAARPARSLAPRAVPAPAPARRAPGGRPTGDPPRPRPARSGGCGRRRPYEHMFAYGSARSGAWPHAAAIAARRATGPGRV